MRWSGAPRKAGYRQIEAAPEEMHGADLAEVARAEALQHPISSDRGVEETRHGLDVVGSIGVVLNEWNRVGHFIGTAVEVRRAADRTEQIAEAPVEVSNRHRAEAELCPAAISGAAAHCMVEEIEVDLDCVRAIGNERCREAPRVNVERRVPGVVDPGRTGEPVLADNLEIEMQSRAGFRAIPRKGYRAKRRSWLVLQ